MSDSAVIEALKEQGRETRQRLDTLSGAMTEMAKAVSALTTTIARVEERHEAQGELVRRIGSESNDHEQRLRVLEKSVDPEQVQINDKRITELERVRYSAGGSWKALVTVGVVAAALVTAASQLIPLIGGA